MACLLTHAPENTVVDFLPVHESYQCDHLEVTFDVEQFVLNPILGFTYNGMIICVPCLPNPSLHVNKCTKMGHGYRDIKMVS